jgi:hypothetical protein
MTGIPLIRKRNFRWSILSSAARRIRWLTPLLLDAISRSAFAIAAAFAFFREVYRSWLKLKMHLSILAEGLMWSIKKVKK